MEWTPPSRRPDKEMKWTPKTPQGKCYSLPVGERTIIMGILNVSPDSFSGDGVSARDEALARGEKLIRDGADIIDVGGQSTRPGAEQISAEEEIERTAPVIKELAAGFDVPVSIDTYKSAVAEKAFLSGAAILNDISGLRFDERMAPLAAEFNVPVVLMHIRGTPENMQKGGIFYEDVIESIKVYLKKSIEIAVGAGIPQGMIIIDPGIGFGKTVEHNLVILKRLKELGELGKPVLIGTSRKSVIGEVLNLPAGERLEGTAATVAVAIANGADIVRVHDVKEMKRVAVMTDAIMRVKR
ncbi:MAG: dihydropteroate synthase [bacterium]